MDTRQLKNLQEAYLESRMPKVEDEIVEFFELDDDVVVGDENEDGFVIEEIYVSEDIGSTVKKIGKGAKRLGSRMGDMGRSNARAQNLRVDREGGVKKSDKGIKRFAKKVKGNIKMVGKNVASGVTGGKAFKKDTQRQQKTAKTLYKKARNKKGDTSAGSTHVGQGLTKNL